MRILRRTDQTPPDDEFLSYFDVAEAHHFRRLVEESFARAGRDVTVHADHAEDRTGTSFGLWNIGALCVGVEPLEWPELIDDHVRCVTTPTCDIRELSQDEFESRLRLRLVDAGASWAPDRLGYAREVVPGLLEVLSVDLPDAVTTLTKEDVVDRGTLRELLEHGRASLRALLASSDAVVETVEAEAGGSFSLLRGSSYFTASLALLLPETLERFSAEIDRGYGVLIAVPSRHQLGFRVIDGRKAVPSLHRMLDVARRGFYDEPGPVSPNVYWVRNRRWTQVTSVEGARARVHLRGELRDALKLSA
jgi:hypothetical protein